MTDNSSAVADVSLTVGVLQPTFLCETLLELNEARTQMDIYRQQLEKLETDHEVEHQRRQQLDYNITSPRRTTSRRIYGYATMK